MIPRVLVRCVFGAVAAITSMPATPHHSYAMFDTGKSMVLDGTIQKADLQNPHSAIYVLATMPSGEAVVWNAETGGPGSLADKIKSSTKPLPIKQYFASGQKVKVTVHPRRDGEHTGSLVRMEFADGRVLDLSSDLPKPDGRTAP